MPMLREFSKKDAMKKYRNIIFAIATIVLSSVSLSAQVLKSKVPYIRDKKIVSVDVPSIEGEYYNDLIPDTLDIAERAQLGINVITENPDPEHDYEFYWVTCFLRNPPFMWHDWSDWDASQWKSCEALSLLRLITGSERNKHVDDIWFQIILRSIGPDGLFYNPLKGRPWSRLNAAWGPTVWCADGSTANYYDESVEYISSPLASGRVLGLLTNYYERDKNPALAKVIERMIDRFLKLMVDKGDYGYLPLGYYEPNAKISGEPDVPTGLIGLETSARMIQAPANYYKFTRYQPAKELSRKLVYCVRYHGKAFDANGRFISGKGMEAERGGSHFHAHSFALLSMLDYAVAADDKEIMSFVTRSYEWARKQGNPTVGFFPEWVRPDYPFSETCSVADMIALAIKLSQAGAADCWDDADRWIRNQFAENQLTKIDCIASAVSKMKKTLPSPNEVIWSGPYKSIPPGAISYDRVLERNIGGFAGWPSANDWINEGDEAYRGIMGCCTGNGTRTLYYIWENILDYKNGTLKVNLLLNRASPWVDVYSYIPWEGQVELKIKKPCTKVLVRMPEWISQGDPQVQCLVDDKGRGFSWEAGKYINVGSVDSGEFVRVKFPISERTVKETIANKEYTLVIRGNTVVSIDPPGKYCPFYQREYYHKNRMPWRPVTRFVSAQVIDY
jgi:hypothetical protein